MSTMGKLFEWARPHKKHVYYLNEGSLDEQHILGAKGANLCEMFRLGMPVPPAFIITADNSMEYFKAGMSNKGYILPQELMADIKKGVIELEHQTNKKFGLGVDQVFDGTPKIPLLLSVRAGSAISMPGMMDTVLNLGINEFVTEHMGKHLNNQRWAFDTYRRFLQMFGTVVLGIDKKRYDNILREMLKSRDVPHESLLSITDMKEVIARFKKIAAVPDDPWEQLDMAIQAVFRSWNSPLAMKYRDINNIPSEYGTAVTVQSMVFGNLNTQSGSGVAFTRNPTTGVKELYGEYLPCSEGEDVSGGLRTPTPLSEMRQQMPTIFDSLMHVERILEKHYRDMQNIEFTVENKVLYILETRAAKRTAQASVCVAVEMVKERMITEREALLRIDASQMDFFLHQMLDYNQVDTQDPQISSRMLCRGAPASPGAAVGAVVFSVAEAMQCALNRTPCILISNETSISDMEGFRAATGMLTMCGGVTSHAAVMMRSLGKPGVVGAQNLTVDWDLCTLTSTANPELIVRTGDTITVDGSQGVVYIGEMPTVSTGTDANFLTVMHWANKYKRMSVLANADTVTQISTAGRLGAEGIGSCRTERMFAHPDCLTHFRRMILFDTTHDRATSLLEMLPRQQEKFLEMFRLVGDHPIVIRLLDPPLHEFLPSPRSSHFDKEIREMAAKIDLPYEVCLRRVMELQQSNPMLGFRGCRLSILYPEITEMQTRAIVGASIQARNENIQVKPQIVIPQVFTDHEVDIITPVITAAANSVFSQMGTRHDLASLQITIGAMIETPRACIRADRIAEAKDISFIEMGSNDLTQLVFGICRQDSHMFMPTYQDLHLVAQDPHMTLDIHGVGGMIQMAVRRCRRVNKNMRVGLTGEHAGDPQSITFFDRMGADYLSCSPFRVPIAKVAAAQAHIEETAIQRHREVEQQRQLLLAPFPMGAYMYGPVFLPKSHYDY